MHTLARFGSFLVVFVTLSVAGFFASASAINYLQNPNIKITYFAFKKICPYVIGWTYNLTNYGGKGYAKVEILVNGKWGGNETDLVLAGQTIGGGGFKEESAQPIANCSSYFATASIVQQWSYSQFPQPKP